MIGKCLRNCTDHNANRYDEGREYDIDPENPCAIHFELPPEGRLIAQEAERNRQMAHALKSKKEVEHE
ncbi:MAG: hypothetical protein ABSG75_14560 [Syntrophales bacterium]|jgi:hypothetical protein